MIGISSALVESNRIAVESWFVRDQEQRKEPESIGSAIAAHILRKMESPGFFRTLVYLGSLATVEEFTKRERVVVKRLEKRKISKSAIRAYIQNERKYERHV